MEVSSRNGHNVELMFMSLIRSLMAAQTPEITSSPVGNRIIKPQIIQRLLFNITRGLRPAGRRLFIGQAEGGPVPSSTLAVLEEETSPKEHIDNSSEVHTSPPVVIDRNVKIYRVSESHRLFQVSTEERLYTRISRIYYKRSWESAEMQRTSKCTLVLPSLQWDWYSQIIAGSRSISRGWFL